MMNYYIQGNAAKAQQIKAAFEKLGYKTIEYCFNAEKTLYFTFGGAIKTATYEPYKSIIITHPDYKKLELPVEPKFKVGDEIAWIEAKGSKPTEPVKIIRLIDKDQLYMVDMSNGVGYVAYDMQDYYKLVPKPHYDISNFHAGMPVLVRDENDGQWNYTAYSYYDSSRAYKFMTSACQSFVQCIPFNEYTKHLLGTTDMPSEEYINW